MLCGNIEKNFGCASINGTCVDGTPIWTSEIFPHDIEELFFDPDFDQNEMHNDDECDSDDGED